MKRKILFIVGILFFSIIVLGTLHIPSEFFNPMDSGLTGISSKNFLSWLKWEIIENKKINEGLLPVYQKPVYKSDPILLCEKISQAEKRYTCLALVKENKEICSEINGIESLDQCHFLIDETRGINSPPICERMESMSQKEKCYEKLAIKLGDPSLCEKAKAIREEETDMEYPSDPCLLQVALAKKDISVCEKIEDQYYKNAMCYVRIAEETQDLSVCEKIEKNGYIGRNAPTGFETADLIDMCYQGVKNSIAKNKAKIEKDISFCKELKSFFREDCYYEVALAKNDASICREITTECKQAECIAVIKNPYACERCVDTGCCSISSLRQTCYNKSAISLEDPTFCGDAGDDSKNDCYFNLALKFADIKIDGQ